MKKTFIDTNILVDLLADRKPFSKYADEIFSAAENKKVKFFTSPKFCLMKVYHAN